MLKTLVVYYSFEGNTRYIAEAIAKELGADIQELKPVKDLKSKGFGKYVWGGRQVMTKKEPVLQPLEKRPEDYDVIFIGTPVWVYTFAPALRSFFVKYPMKRKKVALFICHGGGPKDAMAKFEAQVGECTVIGKLDLMNVLDEEPEQKKKAALEWARKCVDAA
ncbi:MAG: flavodoxin [Thermoplasmata archaeon]|nr:flavodoxin [Thermoplasmata archaeon]